MPRLGSQPSGTDALESDRPQLHETNGRLAREFHQRLHNTIALISSLFSLSALHCDSVTALKARFRLRLLALAGAYRLLDANDWGRVPLQELVERALAEFQDEIHVSGPAVELTPGDALNLTLIVHELCTNATKHGALRLGQGSVYVTWRLEGGHLALIWQEQGGPTATVPKTAGAGFHIIDAAAANIGARVHRVFHRAGLRVLLYLPHSARQA